MDSIIILVWSVVLLAIAGLIVFFIRRNRSREEKALAPLIAFARDNNTNISYNDAWHNTLIGIDNNEINNIFFVRKIPGKEIREKITLSEVSDCRMFKTERRVKYNKDSVNVLDRIGLIFTFHPDKREVALEFYNSDYDPLTISGELQLAQKWTDMIKSVLTTNRDWRVREPKEKPVTQAIVGQAVKRNTSAKQKKERKSEEKAHAI